MTKYEVVVTDPAVEDIVDIVGYLQRLTKSNDTADQYMMGILDIIKSLEEMPSRFQIVDNPDLAELGVRYTFYKNYTISYSVIEIDARVEVYRVLYSGSDVESRVLGTLKE
ncbi:MAG: type II toxin-antitoxin system RelE/ParE family toxin [Candidatus Methanomethylophilaceae archaeon]|nr:type II toxin-antitoxin system RelE/ParE family toxin [Candidatus Methanomethylophilaceae archaeon]